MKNIVILISGRGSNMRAIVEYLKANPQPAGIAAVISNRADAAGLAYAKENGIDTQVLSHKEFSSREAFDTKLAEIIDSYRPDLLVLAGFMRILSKGFVEHYAGRIINIHPAILPSFTGLDTHERAIEAGVKVHGATVHFVTPELDAGPMIVQAGVPVFADDTADTLADRVLSMEHVIYPKAVSWFAADLVKLNSDGKVVYAEGFSDKTFYYRGDDK